MSQRLFRTIQRPVESLPPSVIHYAEFQTAFEFYRDELFDGDLPDCLIVMSRKPRTHGYLAPDRWTNESGLRMHELGLNPVDFAMRSTEEVLSTLVHEMCHAWQFAFGEKVSRTGYHNKEWAEQMEEIGLIPSNTGEPGGKRTGQSMTHYIDEDGDFLRSTIQLIDGGWTIPFIDVPEADPKKKVSRPKYVCRSCGVSVWGKAGLRIECGDCESGFEQETPEDEDDEA